MSALQRAGELSKVFPQEMLKPLSNKAVDDNCCQCKRQLRAVVSFGLSEPSGLDLINKETTVNHY